MDKQTLRNYRSYHIPNQSNHHSIKRNAVFLSTTNGVKHEVAKALVCYMVKKYNDFKISEAIKLALNTIEEEVESFHFLDDASEFLTEACMNEAKDRRIDIINLRTNDKIEIVDSSLSEKSKNDCIIVRV